jgi:hypothetical protein
MDHADDEKSAGCERCRPGSVTAAATVGLYRVRVRIENPDGITADIDR